MKCEFCGSDEGDKDIDPYSQELFNDNEEVIICDKCYKRRMQEV